jgi:hypothetical protein
MCLIQGALAPTSPPGAFKFFKDNKIKGRIFFFNFKTPEKGAEELSFSKGFDQSTFYPHGISTWQDSTTGRMFGN